MLGSVKIQADFDKQLRLLLGELSLYVGWQRTTRNLTTEQKELWADCVDEWLEELGEEPNAMRWWRDDFVQR